MIGITNTTTDKNTFILASIFLDKISLKVRISEMIIKMNKIITHLYGMNIT